MAYIKVFADKEIEPRYQGYCASIARNRASDIRAVGSIPIIALCDEAHINISDNKLKSLLTRFGKKPEYGW